MDFTKGSAPLDEATDALMLSRLTRDGFRERTLPHYLGLREEYLRMYNHQKHSGQK